MSYEILEYWLPITDATSGGPLGGSGIKKSVCSFPLLHDALLSCYTQIWQEVISLLYLCASSCLGNIMLFAVLVFDRAATSAIWVWYWDICVLDMMHMFRGWVGPER